jgi:hypothetical protein
MRELGTSLYRRIMDAGLLLEERDSAFMVHHLISDYLAAIAVGDKPEKWSHDTFDALTFDGASFDPLTILLESLPPTRTDEFLRRVHDWNFYAAAHLLVAARAAGVRVDPAVEVVLLYMLAEKRFERIRASAVHAQAILDAYPGRTAAALSRAESWHEIKDILSGESFDVHWFKMWKSLAIQKHHASARNHELDALSSDEGIIGWTAANLLRRLVLSDAQKFSVMGMTSSILPILRWRAVHVLGSHCDELAQRRLFECLLGDDYFWVRYGALRSLIEAAALGDRQTRREIFSNLTDIANVLINHQPLRRELQRNLDIYPAPDDWAVSAGQLLEGLLEASRDVAEQDRWRRVSARLRLGPDIIEY